MADGTPPEAPPRPGRRTRRWPLVLAGVLLLSGVGVVASTMTALPYYGMAPGQVIEVTDFVDVDGVETFAATGDLYFLTVTVRELTGPEWIEAVLDGEVDLRDREVVRPSGVTREQRRRRGLDQQAEAQQRAIFVALTRLGYEPTISGSGGLVSSVFADTPAEGALEIDDVIVAADGEPIAIGSDLIEALDGKRPGDEVELTVNRLDDDGAERQVGVAIVLGEHPDDPERGFIGVGLDTFEFAADFPLDIAIDSQNIGGPSSGMMYTLGIMNLLTEADLPKGHRVAGTGTIQRDGSVGAIGGVRQKVFAARRVGAEYVLVPERNFEDALTAAGDEIEVVSVATIDEALAFLAALAPA